LGLLRFCYYFYVPVDWIPAIPAGMTAVVVLGFYIPVSWIPAIPAGMTAVVVSSFYVPVDWIPAIPAGMTGLLLFLTAGILVAGPICVLLFLPDGL